MKLLWIFPVLFCAPSAAMADRDGLACDLARKFAPLVAAATGTPHAHTCPDIGFALPSGAGLARSQAGAYHPDSGRIDLSPDLDLTSIEGQGYLLHELVHAAQYGAGLDQTAPCPAALEAHAYHIQADFLQAHGAGREAVMMRLLASQLGTCGAGDLNY